MSYNEPPPGSEPPPYGTPQPGGYGTPPGGYGGPPPPPGYGGGYGGPVNHPQGTTILILGILSLVCCGPLGIAAWVMGNKAIKEIDASGQAYSNRGMVQAGRICGIIAVALMVVAIVFYIILFAVAGSFEVSTG
ncbi:DUF4190 domain-containing protein [Nocardioides sp. YIM 152588]|uniref:DUF4190 domain-containing protein n=1 Tax=Nocardioides sp. YIM 152588 TaxID=3158259 RepID=UPI0032E3745C